MRRELPCIVWIVLLAAGCATPPRSFFHDPWRDSRIAWCENLLRETGEVPPGRRERRIHFLWLRSFHDHYVFTAGFDGEVGYLRWTRRDADGQVWDRPQLRFLTDQETSDLLNPDCGRARDWEDVRGVADGSMWVFTGGDWCAMRNMPEPGSVWHRHGLRFLALAEVSVPADEMY